ncbi:hypothetical protein EVAR_28264_1 [Eumeta japonica]|uniref:Uncharacterized protein n=1 Tax=Eumeta variegata TaxID=151549 RepID=A0A4C1V6I6_EUMVA|nr:hypothetical protein EVAR_28264_1 [Eumeta japonica]
MAHDNITFRQNKIFIQKYKVPRHLCITRRRLPGAPVASCHGAGLVRDALAITILSVRPCAGVRDAVQLFASVYSNGPYKLRAHRCVQPLRPGSVHLSPKYVLGTFSEVRVPNLRPQD